MSAMRGIFMFLAMWAVTATIGDAYLLIRDAARHGAEEAYLEQLKLDRNTTRVDKEHGTVSIPITTYNAVLERMRDMDAAVKDSQKNLLQRAKELANGKNCL